MSDKSSYVHDFILNGSKTIQIICLVLHTYYQTLLKHIYFFLCFMRFWVFFLIIEKKNVFLAVQGDRGFIPPPPFFNGPTTYKKTFFYVCLPKQKFKHCFYNGLICFCLSLEIYLVFILEFYCFYLVFLMVAVVFSQRYI